MAAPPLPIEKFTGALMGVDHELAAMFQGDQFLAHWESASAGVGEESAIGFLTPSLPMRIHLIVDAWANDESVLEIREAPAVTLDAGTDLLVVNRERTIVRAGYNSSSLLASQTTIPSVGDVTRYNVAEANAANLAGGVILHHETLAIGAGPPFGSAMNGVSRAERGFLLLPDIQYVVIQTSSVIGAATHNLILNWMEHMDMNYKH